jgi:tetratricopeptide (TPR) repeat protein
MNQDAYKMSNIFPQTECLTQETLLRYVRNESPKSEIRRVENHILDCPLCAAAVEGLQASNSEGFEMLAASLRKRIQDRVEETKVIDFTAHTAAAAPAPKRRNWVGGLSIAAAVAILFSFAYIFFGNQPSASGIADEYFSLERPRIVRGGFVNPMESGKALMVKKNYTEALEAFDQVGSGESDFLSGDCHFVLEQFDAAAKSYEKVIARQDSEYAHLAEFNLALTHLKLGQIETARVALEKIANNPDHMDNASAGKVLKQLDEIDAH